LLKLFLAISTVPLYAKVNSQTLTPGVSVMSILSLGDIALAEGPEHAGNALRGISEPGGAHSQTA
jgi:hypothetical protein